jgi:hypothetical protein
MLVPPNHLLQKLFQDGKRSLPKGAHVRFSHVEMDGAAQAANAAGEMVYSFLVT